MLHGCQQYIAPLFEATCEAFLRLWKLNKKKIRRKDVRAMSPSQTLSLFSGIHVLWDEWTGTKNVR